MTDPAPLPEVDPVTFEVIKHRLWQINDEQSIAIRTISSSPIVVEGNDFNVGLFSEDGQVTTAGIGSLVHVGTIGDALKSIMRGAGKIRDGDIFLTNDPFLGALHQNDVVLASPLFYGGEIVMWVGNVLHHPDVGGIDEGSFCINARNLYQDPPRYFFKLVDEGELCTRARVHLRHQFPPARHGGARPARADRRHQRRQAAPHRAARRARRADRARGDAAVARSRRTAAARPHPPPAERQLHRRSLDGRRPRRLRAAASRVIVRLTREGDTLHFDFTGSSPQVDAAVNCTYHATVAGAAVPIYTFICQGDIDWNDGVKRCLKVTAPAGTVVNASFPAPVSICTIGFRWLVTVAASQAVAKMLDASEEFRDRVCSSWSVSANCNNLFGVTADGKRVGALLSDHRGGGAAARSFADGFSHSGQTTSFSASMANVESQEWKLPLLYLYRQQLPDSGGAGRWRGGLTAAVALTPIGVPEMVLKSTNTAGTEQSNAHGIDGGYPGAGSQVRVLRGTEVWARLKAGRVPREDADFRRHVSSICRRRPATCSSAATCWFSSRPAAAASAIRSTASPTRVANDVANGWVSRERARENYGVALERRTERPTSAGDEVSARRDPRRTQAAPDRGMDERRSLRASRRHEPSRAAGASRENIELAGRWHAALPPLRRAFERRRRTRRREPSAPLSDRQSVDGAAASWRRSELRAAGDVLPRLRDAARRARSAAHRQRSTLAMFGSRKRIGYISPSVLEVVPFDFYRFAPEGVGPGRRHLQHRRLDARRISTARSAQVKEAAAYLGARRSTSSSTAAARWWWRAARATKT